MFAEGKEPAIGSLRFSLQKIRLHSDELYKLAGQLDPKRMGMWHAHEINKYMAIALYQLDKLEGKL